MERITTNEVETNQFRLFNVETFNEEKRTVELSFSSEEPYLRSFGYEILSHADGSINLTRLKNKAPLLLDHDLTKQIGVVESVTIDSINKKGRAVVRFSKNKHANEIFVDIVDGIRSNISVGYSILEIKRDGELEGQPKYIVTKWEPFEISVVSVPADITVGIGRQHTTTITDIEIESYETNNETEIEINEEKREIEININDSTQSDETEYVNMEQKTETEVEVSANNEVVEMLDIAERFGKVTEAKAFIAEGKTVDEFKSLILNEITPTNIKTMEDNNMSIGLTEKEVKEYSLSRALKAALTDDWRGAEFEKEVSDAVAQKSGRSATSFYIPMEYMTAKRDNTVANSGALVGNTYMASSFIDVLRNKSLMFNLGAQLITGLSGNITIPKQTGATSAYWVAENEDVTASTPTFGTVTMTPKTVGAMASYSRQMLLQANPSIENLIMNDLMATMALEIDRAIIAGTGLNGQPKGILATSGVATVDCSAGLTFAKSVEFETAIANQNYDMNNLKFVTNPTIVGDLKTTAKEAGYPNFIMENGLVNGYGVYATKQIPASTAIFGDFSEILVGAWGGLDINVDKFTSAQNGSVRIVGLQSVDVAVRQPAAFAISTNIA